MRELFRIIALTALLAVLASGVALADKQAYTTMTPEQIEKAIREERQVYRAALDQVRVLENGPMDKKSPEYKARFDELIRAAEDAKVNLDSMREALVEQQKAYGGN
ncbi:hypothetical protein [Fundidesulfovibrio putealis]|uniref:hypothetical protein n=1 Tax=Fundidesulfovibrio putealis TaxID=270496 RepID=UPI00041259CC|nr:hypothetical protein [Fundidesulfovibrio putealis]